MAETTQHLYLSVMAGDFGRITAGVYPGDGVLYPRWVAQDRYVARHAKWVIDQADVDIVEGDDGPDVLPGGGTSLHDVAGWSHGKEFWVPIGTIYSDEIVIRSVSALKTSLQTGVSGRHHHLEVRARMSVSAFKGALDNMARAAVVRQLALARTR
jgi:hypothetical protein